jgi:hypothetical protein
MAWTREIELDAIVDASLGGLNNWDDTTFIWNEITTGKWAISLAWTRETNDG